MHVRCEPKFSFSADSFVRHKDTLLFNGSFRLKRTGFQTELPKLIESRSPKHVTHEELCKLMKWKLTRGKFRPRLTEMVASNSEDEVVAASTKAFKALPNISAAIQALSVLKAVGPATASAVLAAGSPQNAAFMADECLLAFPGLQPIKYDLPFYMAYIDKVKPICKQLNKDNPDAGWTPHKVELTLWTYQMIHALDPALSASLMEESHADREPPRKKQKK
ncbi:uncharacterized protein LOC127866488 isoform X2 [Dreissena polymorpha]|uniref:uncharacterized protein LOC127866488 isoform X2 n=1 Tax=Dreissena polymorpha TaxID=45954 RepID=UPI002263B7A5|nr:uncharacterized protein LOC127866488 isoform X2 [Dreissena polymorpha]